MIGWGYPSNRTAWSPYDVACQIPDVVLRRSPAAAGAAAGAGASTGADAGPGRQAADSPAGPADAGQSGDCDAATGRGVAAAPAAAAAIVGPAQCRRPAVLHPGDR